MKTKIVMFAAAVAMSHSSLALAQSSSTTISAPAAASAAPAATTANTNTATVETKAGVKPVIKYLGILHGPAADFHGAEQADNFGGPGASFDLEHRPKFGVKLNDSLELGTEIRFTSVFAADKVKVNNGSSRIYASFKNVYKDDLVAVTLIPRAVLPTSNSSHNNKMTVSPELLVNVDVAPKDSRFTFNAGLQLIKHLYTDTPVAAKDFNNARSTTVAPWAEIDYQLTPSTQLMVSYWPDLASTRADGAITEQMQELDVGAYIEVVKGWTLNPFLATDFQGLKTSNLEKNTQLNLVISGAIL